jgi:Macrocin-O-methyltransferase (TylF)
VKPIVKFLSSRMSVKFYERAITYSLLRNAFPEVESLREYPDKTAIWSAAIEAAGGREAPITYVEFGVYEGESFRWFLANNTNPSSLFVGLDSFHGLPEAFGILPAGTFDLGGKVPTIDDPRVVLIKGWFKDTWDELSRHLAGRENLLVNHDADLYTSTLFALSRLDLLRRPCVTLFDEFTGPETRAVYDYRQAFGAKLEMMGKVMVNGYAEQVLCRVLPNGV